MCTLGIINSHMKDYCDLIALSHGFEIDGHSLTEVIRATFQRRRTPLPDGIPTGLSEEFAEDAGKQRPWIGYLGRTKPMRSIFRRAKPEHLGWIKIWGERHSRRRHGVSTWGGVPVGWLDRWEGGNAEFIAALKQPRYAGTDTNNGIDKSGRGD